MKSTDKNRLPVSKPDFGLWQSQKRPKQNLAPSTSASSNRSKPPVELGSEKSAEFADPNLASATPLGADSLKEFGFGAATTAFVDSVEIEIAKKADRPFELGDLLTRKWIARNSSFLVSLGVHLVIFLILSAVLLHGTGKALIVLELMSSPDVEEQMGVSVEADLQGDSLEDLFDSELDTFDEFPSLDSGTGVATNEDSISKPVESGSEGTGVEKGDGKSARFFGTRATGNSFVFVLDCSGSMGTFNSPILPNGERDPVTRFAVARNELVNSIETLQPHQEFYVVLFSNKMQRMNDDDTLVPTMLKATRENKDRVREWLEHTRIQGGTDPRKSVKFALNMNPDAMFMLSDGEFLDEHTSDLPPSADIVREHLEKKSPVKINSIAFEDERSKRNMAELASVSGGDFRFVKLAEYRDKLLNSPLGSTRILAIEKLIADSNIQWEQRHKLAVETLIPLLENESESVRKDAESLLNRLSFEVFSSKIHSIARSDDPLKWKQARRQWSEVWKAADQFEENKDVSSDIGFFRALAVGAQELDRGKIKEYGKQHFTKLENSDLDLLSSDELIAEARKILAFQLSLENEPEKSSFTHELFLKILLKLNKESSRFNEDYFLKNADYDRCKSRLDKVLANRSQVGRSLLRGWRNKNFSEQKRKSKLMHLLNNFPETASAIEVRSELRNLPELQPMNTD